MSQSKQTQQRTRRQHWLPQTSYLEQFTVKGRVKTYWFSDEGKANFVKTASVKDIAPINVGVKSNLYETPALPDNTIENVLAKIEGDYGSVLETKIKPGKKLSEADHRKVSLYVSALESRSIAQQKHLNGFLDRLNEKGRAVSLVNNAPDAAEKWTKEMEEAKEHFFAQNIAAALELDKWNALDFCFLSPASFVHGEFITSDQPVTIVDMTGENSPYGVNHWSKTAECVVVLTPNIALFGNTRGITGYKEVDYNLLREINNRVLRRADKMIISSKPVTEAENKNMVDRTAQSLILKYAKLPGGRFDRRLRKYKALEEQQKSEANSD